MGLDFEFSGMNFGLGFVAGSLSTAAVLRIWRQIQAVRENRDIDVQIDTRERTFASRFSDRRLLREMVRLCQTQHLAGSRITLSEILVEPHFLHPEPVVEMPSDDYVQNVFGDVPRVHDFPFLHAPFNLPDMTIKDISQGDKALVLTGLPGSGRTTALMAIALWSMGQVDFTPPTDIVEQQIAASDEDLSAEERAERIKYRIRMMQLAQRRMAEMRGEIITEDADDDEFEEELSPFRRLMPIYVHLSNVRVLRGGYGSDVDPAEPLVRALQAETGWLTSKSLPRPVYRLLNEGRALLLIDGYDELPEAEKREAMAWLSALLNMYSDNFMIVTAPIRGYLPFVDMGFSPIFMRPWSDYEIAAMADKWAANWSTIHAGDDDKPVPGMRERIKQTGRATLPVDLTLRLWSNYAGDSGSNQSGFTQDYLNRLLPNTPDWMPVLKRLATLELTEGYITRKTLFELEIAQTLSSPVAKRRDTAEAVQEAMAEDTDSAEAVDEPEAEPDFIAALNTESDDVDDVDLDMDDADMVDDPVLDDVADDADTVDDLPDDIPEALDRRLRRRISREQAQLLKYLVDQGVLMMYREGRYRFRQRRVAAYLAGLTLVDADDNMLREVAQEPGWYHALGYASQHRSIEAAVRATLYQTPDLSLNHVLDCLPWLAYAGRDATWRDDIFEYARSLFLAAGQYRTVRQRIAAAVVSARDFEQSQALFRQAVRQTDPLLRQIGCLGLGAIRDEGGAVALRKLMNGDDDPDVQVTAALGLGAIGTEDALLTLADAIMTSESQNVRRVIAEIFAADPEQGYPTLYDALQQEGIEDILLRRAVVFGLGRIRKDWALIALNETLMSNLEEDYVQLAVEDVFRNNYEMEQRGVRGYPQAGAVPWLSAWSIQQIQEGKIPEDISSERALDHAMQQRADPVVRQLAVATIGQLGTLPLTEQLYQQLRDRDAVIRDTAYASLASIQMKLGDPLPAPVLNGH